MQREIMSAAESDLAALLRALQPVRNGGTYVYASLPPGSDIAACAAVAAIREKEGWTVVVEEAQARRAGLQALFRCAWITLEVHSDLQAIGLTAAVAAALSQADIACNVIAGAHHDHLFVPVESTDRAMTALQALQQSVAC